MLKSVATGEITLPSLAEWLVNDSETPPGGATTVTTPSALTTALSNAGPGDTIVCNPSGGAGTIAFWSLPSGINIPNGSANNFVTVMAALNKGIVVSAGENFAAARTPNNSFWNQTGLSTNDVNKNIWRSAATFSGGEQAMMGFWVEFDEPHQLMRYSSMTNLRSAYGQDNSIANYATAGVHKASDGRVYIRMQKPHPIKYSRGNKWSETTYYGHPEAINSGQMAMPVSTNPNTYPIYLWRANTTGAFMDSQAAHHIRVGPGINSLGFRWAFDGASFIQGDRGLHWTWQSGIRSSSADNPKNNFYFNRTRFTDGSKAHAALSDWKFGGWLEGIRSAFFTGRDFTNIYFKDCTIGHYHDVVTSGRASHSIRFRNCTFYNTFDDGFQTVYSTSRVELGYCYLYNSDWGGFGESGDDGTVLFPHQWYVHHNIIDDRREKCPNWRAETPPKDVHTPHSPNGNNAFKIYNNIVFCGPDRQEEFGIGFEHSPQGSGGGNNTATGAANAHQVFNNIILLNFLEGTKRYNPIVTNPDAQYSDISGQQNRSDFVGNRQTRYSAAHSNELQDYNLYWRPSGMRTNGLLRMQRGAGQTVTVYASLTAWRNSAEFEHSKLSGTWRPAYSPGFEGNSTQTAPSIPSRNDWPNNRFQYRPAATSAVTVASNGSLNGQNWWIGLGPSWGRAYFPWNDGAMTLAPDAWKGPLDPNGSTMPIGVQNP